MVLILIAYKELMRVIKFVLDTKSYGLKVKPKIESKDQLWSMKHIDIHYQYVHEFVMDGFMKIVFV